MTDEEQTAALLGLVLGGPLGGAVLVMLLRARAGAIARALGLTLDGTVQL